MTSSTMNLTSSYDVTTGTNSDVISGVWAMIGACVGTCIVSVGAFGNVLVILSVLYSKPLQRSSSAFIVSLASCDLFQTVLVRPLYVHAYVTGGWVFGQEVCRYALYASNLATLEAILHVTVMAAYRYVIIVHPACARRLQSGRAVAAIIAILYIVVPAIVVLLPVLSRMRHGDSSSARDVMFDARIMFCVYRKYTDAASKADDVISSFDNVTYHDVSATPDDIVSSSPTASGSLVGIAKKLGFLFVTSALLFFAYLRIYHVVRASGRHVARHQGSHAQSPARMRREMALLKTVIVIFVAFVISYVPVTILYALDRPGTSSRHVVTSTHPAYYVIAVLLLWSSSSANWMIYGLMNRQFLKAYRTVLCGPEAPYLYANERRLPGCSNKMVASRATVGRRSCDLNGHRSISRGRDGGSFADSSFN